MKQNDAGRLLGVLALTLVAQPLFAHTTAMSGADPAAGMLHPLLGADHLLAMLAVGVWAAQLSGATLWRLATAFALALLLGVQLSMTGVLFPAVEPIVATTLLLCGLMIALQLRCAPRLAVGLLVLFGLFQGYTHATVLGENALPYSAGLIAMSVLLQLAGLATGHMLRRWHGALYRLSGAGLAFAGGGLLLV